jgi:site-specific recombinase XerD
MNIGPWEITRGMFLSEEEVAALCRHLRSQEEAALPKERPAAVTDRLIIESLIFSGLRNTEFCNLRVADTITGHGESSFHVVGTPHQDRMVYVPHELSALVRRFVRDVRPRMLNADVDPDDADQPLVVNERGKPYERTGLYRRVVRILTEAGMGERASVQLLRHTYGYLAYKRTGGNLLFVQRQLGHAHPMVTAIYAQFVDEPYSQLADAVGGETEMSFSRLALGHRSKRRRTRR